MFYYVGTEYSRHKDGLEAAFQMACEQTALLIRAGINVLSPIVHSHPLAVQSCLDPLDHELWMRVDAPLMSAAYGLIVVETEGWRESRGLAVEIKTFRAAGKPIIHMTPGVVPAGLWHFDKAAAAD